MNPILNISRNHTDVSIKEELRRIADFFLNSSLFYIENEAFRITELECYFYSDAHPDSYTHRNPRQALNGLWYFHRLKNPEKYRNLKQKGLDITIGNIGTASFGGILIRKISRFPEGESYNGPALIINKIIDTIGYAVLNDLGIADASIFTRENSLHIEPFVMERRLVLSGKRIGLNSLRFPGYAEREYRFFTRPD
ncbi:MAG: hypothetical protein K1X92_14725 [Bacteroidia bacterium]|nr:hypothetical protein [Bacteroidia bacterium]